MGAFLRKYATATHIYLPLVKRGVVDFAVGADWTPATGDVKVSIDGGAAANIGTLPTAIAMGNGAIWDFTIATGEVTGKKITITVADSATKAVEDQCFEIETYGHASAEYQADFSLPNLPANVTQLLGTTLTETSAGYLTAGFKKLFDVAAPVLTAASVNQTGDAYSVANTRLPAALTANGNIKASLMEIIATALTETSGQIAAAFTKFFDKATPTGTINSLPDAVAGAAGGVSIVGSAMTLSSAAVQSIWDATTSALTTVGSIGKALVTLITDYTTARAAKIDNLDATVSSRMATYTQPVGFLAASFPTDPADQSLVIDATNAIMSRLGAPAGASMSADIADLPTNAELATALAAADDATLTAIAALSVPTANQNAAAVLAAAVEGAETLAEALRLIRAAVVGKSDGFPTGPAHFRDKADAKNRITATVDADGNRTVVTTDAS